MKKSHQFFVIGLVILLAIAAAVGVIFYNGGRMLNSHFVRLEVNPKVEFLTNSDNKVESIYPVNQDAYDLIVGEEWVGLNITDAVTKFLTLCAKAGYIDVDGKNNAVGLAVSSGFLQAFENEIYSTINIFYKSNEIFGVIAEADCDLANYKEKKAKNVSSIEKLVVIKSVLEKSDEYTFEQLNGIRECELIDMLEDLHTAYAPRLLDYSALDTQPRLTRIANNQDKYTQHMQSISNFTQRKFASEFEKFKKENTSKYEQDYNSQYAEYSD